MVRALLLALTLAISGCALLGSGEKPLKTVRYLNTPDRPGQTLIVLLPGIYDSDRTFARENFIRMARQRGLDADFVAADADVAYYLADTVVPRLETDVIGPARRAGYRNIWLVGVSLGGLGALAYLQRHPDQIRGVLLLSPYLGDGDAVEPIARAGSLAAWQPDGRCARDKFCTLWAWLKDYAAAPAKPGRPTMLLGYGDDDRFPEAHRLLAQALGPARTTVIRGEHDWTTWRRLWAQYLEQQWPERVLGAR